MILALLLAMTPADSLHALIDRDWASRLAESPQRATYAGVHEYDDRLGQVDEASQQRRLVELKQRFAELQAIPRGGLPRADQVNAEVLAEELRARIAHIEVKQYLITIQGDESFYSNLSQLPRNQPLHDVAEYEKYLKRLRDIPRYFDENLALMRTGLKLGMTSPQVILKGRDQAARMHAVNDVHQSVFYKPFEKIPAAIPAAEAARLRAAGEAAIREAVVPAYAKVAKFIAEEYIPGARKTIAASELPGGREYYRSQIREYVTKDISPEEIHALGLREVARIHAEMESIKTEVGFKGDFAAFLVYLRTDPQFYAKTPEELLMRAAYIAKDIDGRLPAFFGVLPRLPYRVEAVPADIAPFYTGGRYVEASAGSDEPGTYWVNTYDLKSRPLYVLPALTLHEAVPGHHLQIALAAEQHGLPAFRRFSYFSVTGEGWGLYAEKLGQEMGVYKTPYERFGRLTYEMWRACRLVVDTGMHAMGWPREKSISFMRDNTALSEHEIETETDRYIGWPGQALSYKIGELAILELRRKAEVALGPRFDKRKFHDAILSTGSVPLPVLEEEIDRFINQSH
ncbi:MAG TPA: DUF885 domain-containing protein [Myxococcales bacterium]|nr:DUF885 domain-containing protein [Myxococcales bacterium]